MMKIKMTRISAMLTAVAVFMCSACFAWAEEPAAYVENEQNYVDGSMDVTHGIPEDAEGVLARIKERGVLRVATEPYFAPQEFIDPELEGQDRYVGADMMLARRIAERMGVKLVIVEMEFTEVLGAVANDECDLAISALSYIPSRAAAYTVSKGYYFSEMPKTVMIIRAEDADSITTVEDLKEKTIVAQQGSLQEAAVTGNVIHYKEFRRVSRTGDVYTMVQSGAADAGALDAENAVNYLENNPECGLMIVANIEFVMNEGYRGDRVMAKQGEYMLMYFVNGVIDEVLAEDLYEQWIEEASARAAELGL